MNQLATESRVCGRTFHGVFWAAAGLRASGDESAPERRGGRRRDRTAAESRVPRWDCARPRPVVAQGIACLDLSDDGRFVAVGTIAPPGDPNLFVLDDSGKIVGATSRRPPLAQRGDRLGRRPLRRRAVHHSRRHGGRRAAILRASAEGKELDAGLRPVPVPRLPPGGSACSITATIRTTCRASPAGPATAGWSPATTRSIGCRRTIPRDGPAGAPGPRRDHGDGRQPQRARAVARSPRRRGAGRPTASSRISSC